MTPDLLEVGKPYPGQVPNEDGALFEFPKTGPELRLFFSSPPQAMVESVTHDEVWLGVLRHGDIGIVPWRIGEHLRGDAQFHIFLYLPESRPTDEILSQYHRYHVQITLVDRSAKELRVIRRMTMSHELSVLFNEIVAYQLGNHIGREEYDAQVSIYQNKFPDLQTVVDAADRFEQLEAAPDDPEMAARVRNR